MEKLQYRIMYQDLKQKILLGVFKTGDLLPSENELAALFKTTRVTVRQALDELVKEGYIFKEKGKGSFVQSERGFLGLLAFKDFKELGQKKMHGITTKLVKKPWIMPWPEDFFYPLTPTELKMKCVCIKRIRYVDEDPVMLEYYFIPNLKLDKLCVDDFIDGSLLKTLRIKHLIEITNVEQFMKGISANEIVAENLNIAVNQPIIKIFRRHTTNKKNFFFFSTLETYTEKYAISHLFTKDVSY
jgi:DNA-binding GntR family transcriptional regulator